RARGVGALCRVLGARAHHERRDHAVLAARGDTRDRHAALAARLATARTQPRRLARATGGWYRARARDQRGGRSVPAAAARRGPTVIQTLVSVATHAAALLLYPGLATMLAFGAVVELAWLRVSRRDWAWPEAPRRRVTAVLATVTL